MDVHAMFGAVAGVLVFVEFGLYILAIYGRDYRLCALRVPTTPNRATWFIWALLGIITAASYWAIGATDTVWYACAYAIGFISVAIMSIWYGEGGVDTLDIFCLLGAMVSALFWWKFNSPTVALVMTMTIDACGMVPTLRKIWTKPESENALAWSVSAVASASNILAISWVSASLPIVAYPVYMAVANMSAALLLRVPRPQRSS